MPLLSPDSEFMVTLGKITDYILVSLLALLCSLPIVTFGAAMTAKYYVAMKISRGEEPEIVKPFFKAFKENFKQATIVWMLAVVLVMVYTVDWYIMFVVKQNAISTFGFILLIMTVLLLCILCNIFPLLARFNMSIKELLKGAFVFTMLHLPRTLLSLVMIVLPIIISIWYIEWLPAILLFFGFIAVYYNSHMYVKHFRKLEIASGYVEADEDEDESFTLKFDDEDDEKNNASDEAGALSEADSTEQESESLEE